jgi:phosphatidylglycerol:prolipoprotein diacylglycerol transferase
LGVLALFIIFFSIYAPARKNAFDHLLVVFIICVAAAVAAKIGESLIEGVAAAVSGRDPIVAALGAGSTITTGLVGAFLAIWAVSIKDPGRIVTREFVDAFCVAIPFGHALGRIGCWFNGCCFGSICPADFPLAATYPDHWEAHFGLPAGPRYPAPLIEAAALFVLGVVLLIVYKATRTRGQALAVYAISYGVIRFSVESLRGDEIRGIWLSLATGQWFAIGFFAFGVFKLVNYLKDRTSGLASPPFRAFVETKR